MGSNPLLKIAAKCIECCLWCFKKTIEFINSYAYIYCFVENIGFCSGCMKTFELILRYPAQIAINTSVQRVLALLLSLTTPLICGTLAFLWWAREGPNARARRSSSRLGCGSAAPPTIASDILPTAASRL